MYYIKSEMPEELKNQIAKKKNSLRYPQKEYVNGKVKVVRY
jgi:hypothetical protein